MTCRIVSWNLELVVLSLSLLFVRLSSVSGHTYSCDTSQKHTLTESWHPLDPEKTLYAYTRCLNDSSASLATKIHWVRWQPDDSPESQCYVKCVSEELRLFDSRTKRFNPERFALQAKAYGNLNPAEEALIGENAQRMLAGELDDTACETIFRKYAPFYIAHTATIMRMFHGSNRGVIDTYQMLGDKVKQPGQTFIDYCEKQHDSSWKHGSTCHQPALLGCVLRGFRWITPEGDTNVAEIQRDYEMSGLKEKMNYCPNADGQPIDPVALYLCLHSQSPSKLRQVIEDRNRRTAMYFDITSQEEPWKSAVQFAISFE